MNGSIRPPMGAYPCVRRARTAEATYERQMEGRDLPQSFGRSDDSHQASDPVDTWRALCAGRPRSGGARTGRISAPCFYRFGKTKFAGDIMRYFRLATAVRSCDVRRASVWSLVCAECSLLAARRESKVSSSAVTSQRKVGLRLAPDTSRFVCESRYRSTRTTVRGYRESSGVTRQRCCCGIVASKVALTLSSQSKFLCRSRKQAQRALTASGPGESKN
jgi:hypothetical protein